MDNNKIDPRNVVYRRSRAQKIELNQCTASESTNTRIVVDVRLKPITAVILYPSFGCPAIVKSGESIRLFLLATKEFQDLVDGDTKTIPYKAENSPSTPGLSELYFKVGGPHATVEINTRLKMFPWSQGKSIEDVPLYPDTDTAIANIDVYSLGDTNGFKDGRIRDKDKKIFALLRKSTSDFYQKEPLSVKYLFEVHLNNPKAMSKPPAPEELYDLAWLLPGPDSEQCTALEAFAEPQDRVTQSFVQNNAVRSCLVGEPYAYKIYKDNKSKPFDFELDQDSPIQNRHPVRVTANKILNIGHLTDVHVSSRQFVFRKSRAQVLQSNTPKCVSEIIGDIVNVNFDTLKNLLDQMGKDGDIDTLVITGDLVDHNLNLDPVAVENNKIDLSKPSAIWEILHSEHHDDRSRYPKFIDDRLIYSLIIYFYNEYKKPVFILQGNHELYTSPFGISPRLPLIDHANRGIPADHNLTIYEALLMYGPDYDHTKKLDPTFNIFKSHERLNSENLEWFYNVFTPFTDFAVEYQDQCFLGLGWGDDENIVSKSWMKGGGTLPRANESLSHAQVALIMATDEFVKDSGKHRIILSHFTLASYELSKRLFPLASYDLSKQRNEIGEIYFDYRSNNPGVYDQGSFIENRIALYSRLDTPSIHYTLSGHSHRAGLYELTEFDYSAPMKCKVRGYEIPLTEHEGSLSNFKKCRVITSACGGPIATQNMYGDSESGLADCGLDWPSGTKLSFNDGEKIQRIIPKELLTAKPRFAVALDYFDLFGESPVKKVAGGAVFTLFLHNQTKNGAFWVRINDNLPDRKFIKAMRLFGYIRSEWASFDLEISYVSEQQSLDLTLTNGWKRFNETMLDNKNPPVMFMSVSFNEEQLKYRPGYSQYDYRSPWIFRIETLLIDFNLRIRRHSKHGEKPDFKWYSKMFDQLYAFERSWVKTVETNDMQTETKGN